jgi:hypothetical protein
MILNVLALLSYTWQSEKNNILKPIVDLEQHVNAYYL